MKPRNGLALLMTAAALLMALGGCGGQGAERSSPLSGWEQSEPDAGSFTDYQVFRYVPGQDAYLRVEAGEQPPFSLVELPRMVAEREWPDVTVSNTSLEDRDGIPRLIIEFPAGGCPAAGAGSSRESQVLNTLAMTAMQRSQGNLQVVFRISGGPYESGHYAFEADEAYVPAPYRELESPQSYYEALRREAGYPGMWEMEGWYDELLPTDDTGRLIIELLARIGDPQTDFASPGEIPPDLLLKTALGNTRHLTVNDQPMEGKEQRAPEGLLPLSRDVGAQSFLLQEHVEETARRLFGEGSLTHQDYWLWTYRPVEGVYLPPGAGRETPSFPALLGYEAVEGGYRAQVVYLRMGMDNTYLTETMEVISPGELESYIASQPRRQVVVKQAVDGGLYLYSHTHLSQ